MLSRQDAKIAKNQIRISKFESRIFLGGLCAFARVIVFPISLIQNLDRKFQISFARFLYFDCANSSHTIHFFIALRRQDRKENFGCSSSLASFAPLRESQIFRSRFHQPKISNIFGSILDFRFLIKGNCQISMRATSVR